MTTIVISPQGVVNAPNVGGHFWVYMQYAQGLLRLGCEVYWLERFTNRGNLVVDPFGGSWTVAVAARRLHRRFLGADINPECRTIWEKRMRNGD